MSSYQAWFQCINGCEQRFSLFDVIFRHVEEYDGLPDLLTLYAFILEAEQSAAAYARDYGGAVREFTKAQWVKAFPRVLDHPAAAEIVLACLRVQAVNARRVSVL